MRNLSYRRGLTCSLHSLFPCYNHIRFIHEKPFAYARQVDSLREESYEAARDALLQLNIMIRRGIEPDALMYTSLINVMGCAGLEWQAYKLFSRMIESNVHPLPETYLALRNATAKHRTRLLNEIEVKIEQSMEILPEHLAEVELARQREENRQCIAKFEEYMKGKLPAPLPLLAGSVDSKMSPNTELHAPASSLSPTGKTIATMHIRNPTDAWSTADMAGKVRDRPHQLAKGLQAQALRELLLKLDEEELRIYLAAQRQLRHGSKEQLVNRILENVSANSISSMLDRRKHYFRSVEKILAADLQELQRAVDTQAEAKPHSKRDTVYAQVDHTLKKEELASAAPEVLLTPWGLIRKPLKAHHSEDSLAPVGPSRSERLDRVRLMDPELVLVWEKAQSRELDEIPESLLRRYAYQFQLHWRRRMPLSLINAVEWHATTMLPALIARSGSPMRDGQALTGSIPFASDPLPTLPECLQRQHEDEGMRQTLENYEAFRIISHRTNNLQIVDDKEVNLHIKRVERENIRQKRKDEELMRREKNLMAMATLAASARDFSLMDSAESEKAAHVLGLVNTGDVEGIQRLSRHEACRTPDERPSVGPSRVNKLDLDRAGTEPASMPVSSVIGNSVAKMAEELPPWELFSEADEFNLSSGHFGDPEVGRYQELSDSKIRLLPSRLAAKEWSVDRRLLPDQLRDVVESVELKHKERLESVENEYYRRLQYKKYRKWDNLLRKSQEKSSRSAATVKEGRKIVQPLPARKRLAQLLRSGHDRAKVSESLRERFSRSL